MADTLPCRPHLRCAVLVAVVLQSASVVADESPGAAPEWSSEFVAEAIAAAREPGDARRGAGVFHAAATGCGTCHRVGGQGGVVGPELTTVATCLTPEEIAEALSWPARRVKPEYRAWGLTLADGRVLRGVLARETPERVSLIDAAGSSHDIPVGGVLPASLRGTAGRTC